MNKNAELKILNLHSSQILADRINTLSEKILNFTPQLYHTVKDAQDLSPKPLASSVLIKSEKFYYLVSAKHAFEHLDIWEIGIFMNKTFYGIQGTISSALDDNIDISIIKLSKEFIDIISKKYDFLEKHHIDPNHICTKKEQYFKAGFPNSGTKIKKHDKTIRISPFILLTTAKNEGNNHIVVDIPKKRRCFTNNIPVVNLPVLTGMSGSGLWYISDIYNLKFKLVALMIEQIYDGNTLKYTKGTKANIITNAIEECEAD